MQESESECTPMCSVERASPKPHGALIAGYIRYAATFLALLFGVLNMLTRSSGEVSDSLLVGNLVSCVVMLVAWRSQVILSRPMSTEYHYHDSAKMVQVRRAKDS